MTFWESRRLGDMTSKIGSGATPRGGKSVYQGDGTSLIRSQNVYDLRFDHEGIAHISDQAAAALKGVTVSSGDVLVNITGESVTRTCLVDDAALPARVSQHVAIVRPKPGELDSKYLLYALISPPTKARLNTLSEAGATRRALTKGHLEALEIALPPVEEQERIAGVLGAFDDLIETNRLLIQRLDGLFQSLWRQDYIGRADSPIKVLADIAETQYGLTASASQDSEGVKFLRVTDINKQNWIDWATVPTVSPIEVQGDKYRLRPGDLLVARMADPGKSAIYEGGPGAVFASYLVRLKPHNFEDGLYLYGFLKSREYAGYATGAMSGSVQKNMNARVISAASLRWPSAPERMDFAGRVAPIRAAQSALLDEVADLARQRDELLPLLMSGKVRVRDAEGVA